MMASTNDVTEDVLRQALEEFRHGDPAGIFTVALTLIARIPERKNWMDLYIADVLLETAARQGVTDAQEYLDDTWPGLRATFVDRVSRQ